MGEAFYSGRVHASIASSLDPTIDLIMKHVDLAPFRLDSVQAIHIAVIMEDLFDQLEVLGSAQAGPTVELRSKTSFYDHQPSKHGAWWDKPDFRSASNMFPHDDVGFLSKHQYNSRIPKLLFETYFPRAPKPTRRLTEIIRCSGIKTDNAAGKLQADRAFLQWSLHLILEDLLKHNSFEALKSVIEGEQNRKKYMTDVFSKILQDMERIKQLKIDIKKTKKEKLKEFQTLDAQIFETRDNLLELQFRKPLEAAYVQKCGKATISRVRKMCLKTEKEAGDDMKEAKFHIANESRCHDAMMKIIKSKMKNTKTLYDYWADRYEKDTTRLQAELDEIKLERSRDLSRMTYLRKMIDDYEEIVQDDRRIKKLSTDKVLKNEREKKNATRLQAWWRGTMVRRALGPFKLLVADLRARRNSRSEKKN
ncbi:dynein regulatory complex protein 9-like isoform X2 [Biomphalaria glabrata]|uniref:Dynein regulatory complex protein 9 n=1 Tax=Biomphalaria glabrata TaxID=6526 RepID=A0A9W3BJA2_BIOGL|nr:dynein regulatory complex protein 9-like isoform X2 [Biomphalaria glabrata]